MSRTFFLKADEKSSKRFYCSTDWIFFIKTVWKVFEKTNIFRTAGSGFWVFSKIGRWLMCDVKYMITMNKLRFVPMILWPNAALGIDKWQVVWKVVFCRCSAATSTVLTTTEWKLHARVHHIHPSTLLWFFFFFWCFLFFWICRLGWLSTALLLKR